MSDQPGEGGPDQGQPNDGAASDADGGRGEGQGEGQGKGQGEGGGGQAGQPGKGGQPGGAGGQPGGGGGQPGEGGGGGGPGAPGSLSDGGGGSGGAGGDSLTADAADGRDAREASSLVTKRLREELESGNLDRDLMDDLGYSEEDVRRFARKLEDRLNAADPKNLREAAERRQFEALLDRMDRDAGGATLRGEGDGPAAGGFAAPRRPTPAEYQDLSRSYKQRLLRKSNGK